MRTRASYIWEQRRSTYWFIPMAMVTLAVALSTDSVPCTFGVRGTLGVSEHGLQERIGSGRAGEIR